MTEPVAIAMGVCAVHGGAFYFDPDRVPTVLIDPATGRPPDVDEAGNQCEPEPGAAERSTGRPYCPPCAAQMNRMLRNAGLDQVFDETDTAAGLL